MISSQSSCSQDGSPESSAIKCNKKRSRGQAVANGMSANCVVNNNGKKKKKKKLEAFKHFFFCLPFMILLHIRMRDLRHRARRTVKCGRVDLPNLCTGSCSWCNSLLWPGSPPSSGRRAARSSPPRNDLSCTRNLRLHSPKRRGGDIQGKDLDKKILISVAAGK